MGGWIGKPGCVRLEEKGKKRGELLSSGDDERCFWLTCVAKEDIRILLRTSSPLTSPQSTSAIGEAMAKVARMRALMAAVNCMSTRGFGVLITQAKV